MDKNKTFLGIDHSKSKDKTRVYVAQLIDGKVVYIDNGIHVLPELEFRKLYQGSFEKVDKDELVD